MLVTKSLLVDGSGLRVVVRFVSLFASRSSAQEPVLPSLPGWPVAGWLAGWLTAGLLALSLNSTQTCIWVSFLSCSLFSYGWPFHLVTRCNHVSYFSKFIILQ